MPPALILAGSKTFEDRPQILDRFLVPADHHAVALFQSPHAARGAYINELKALCGDLFVVTLRILVVRVSAINQNVALVEQRFEFRNSVVYRLTLRDHDPDRLPSLQIFSQI